MDLKFNVFCYTTASFQDFTHLVCASQLYEGDQVSLQYPNKLVLVVSVEVKLVVSPYLSQMDTPPMTSSSTGREEVTGAQ